MESVVLCARVMEVQVHIEQISYTLEHKMAALPFTSFTFQKNTYTECVTVCVHIR